MMEKKAFQVVVAAGSRSMKLRTHVLKATVYFDACLVEHEWVNGHNLEWMDVYGPWQDGSLGHSLL